MANMPLPQRCISEQWFSSTFSSHRDPDL